MNLEQAIAYINSGQPVPQNHQAWVVVATAAVSGDKQAQQEMTKWGVRPVIQAGEGGSKVAGVTKAPGSGMAGSFAPTDFVSGQGAAAGTPIPTGTSTAAPPTPTPGTGPTPRGEAPAARSSPPFDSTAGVAARERSGPGGTQDRAMAAQNRAGQTARGVGAELPNARPGMTQRNNDARRIQATADRGETDFMSREAGAAMLANPAGGFSGMNNTGPGDTTTSGLSMNPANPNDPNAGLGQVPAGYFLRDLGVTEAGLGELDPYSNEGSAQILRLILGNNGLGNTPLAQYLSDDAQGAAILNLILGGNLLAGTPGREPVSRSQQLMGMEDILERSYGPNKEGQYYDPSAILGLGLDQAGQYPLGSGGMDDVTGGYADQADLVGYSVGAAAPYMDPLSAAHMASSFGRARQSYDDQWLMGKTQGSYIDFLRQLGMM